MYRCAISISLVLCFAVASGIEDRAKPAKGPNSSLYNFNFNDASGKAIDFKVFQGKVILVVNVASECGFTDGQYRGLQVLHDLLKISDRFSVVAFPCNQFGGQEPKSNKEIYEFATKQYKASFPIMEKVDVIGETAHDFWKLLEYQTGQPPNWNFWKYLVDYQGNVINFWGPWNTVEEITPNIKDAVDQAIKELARKRQSTESAGMPSTEDQVQPEGMSRAPPLPLHRARPPPPPKIPSAQPLQAPPPPTEDKVKTGKILLPPPPPKGGKSKIPRPPPGPPSPASGDKDKQKDSKTEL